LLLLPLPVHLAKRQERHDALLTVRTDR
jgi:hypothetical protein